MGYRIGLLLVFFARAGFACDSHPGVPHEQWMRWVDGLNAKYAAEQAAKSQGAAAAAKSVAADPLARKAVPETGRAIRRPVSDDGQVRSLRQR